MSSLRKRKQIFSDSSDNEDEKVIQAKQHCKQVKFSSNGVDAMKEFFKEVSKPTWHKICQKFLTENPDTKRSAKQIQDKVKQLWQC